ncbi:patatin-like phospholipase family protein [Massilia cavernae]|uniref:Patatin-like phospholipase family protein n=1 Tax=Massilia cavernae TaxID=2320864 RepID=A0A418Y4B6_9BURK|nr:patatin-like phospholipase family protein [Massilia cavernae]RJG20481.1 patatin-like phospholipase family protein [Massilia cavernae]
MANANRLNPHGLKIALVLQGGGALGAYQAGVFQAMHEHDLAPDWVVGTSIGAINAALIAGNPHEHRVQRLRTFWERISHPDPVDMQRLSDRARRNNIWLSTIDTLVRGVPGFFRPRWYQQFALGVPVAPEQASFYNTGELRETLLELVDFDYLNAPQGMRMTVNAVNVGSGELVHFDSTAMRLEVDHILASCSLPPGFPPVRIDGALYWDGGLYSNTPLESVLNGMPQGDVLCFMVDLWSAHGPEPLTFDEVQTRQKDVTYASRSRRHIADYARLHRLQCKLRELYARMDPAERSPEDERELVALGCATTLHIVRLPYSGRDWNMAAKDINFSKGSIDWRWDQGYRDAMRALGHAGWLSQIAEDAAVVVHELPERRSRPESRPPEPDRWA